MPKGKGKVQVLVNETLQSFNIDFNALSAGSHKKICVVCLRCDETFTRERRKLYQLHMCPTHKLRELDNEPLKWCNRCSMFLTYKCFKKNSARVDNLDSWCKVCFKTTSSFDKHRNSCKLLRKTFDGWLKGYISSKKAGCKRKGFKFTLTFDFLKQLWSDQNGQCYYSNVGLEYGKRNLNGATLDRIDSSEGYTIHNVVWCSYALNNMKNKFSENDLNQFLSKARFNRIRLEYNFINTDAKIPFRKRTTDAGYDLYAVEATSLPSGKLTMVKTGICISCPEEFYFTIEGRSGLYSKGIFPTRGIIDAGYTGEIIVGLYNTGETYVIEKGDRMAQIILHQQTNADFSKVDEFSPNYSSRGQAGFGSSGR